MKEHSVSNKIRLPSPDPLRKIRFREAARAIVFKDRRDRKNGLSVDTAGAIARALEQSYRQGFVEAQSDDCELHDGADSPDGPVEWAAIPPRPRNAFWSICIRTLRWGQQRGSGHLIPTVTERGTPGWRLILPDREEEKEAIGEKTIIPLVRLGLLEVADTDATQLIISERGLATWQLFRERGGQFAEDLTVI